MLLFKTYFDSTQLLLLASGITSFILSLFFFLKEKEKLSIFFLVLTSLFFNCFAALLDPYLNLWDERFHALVAKNMMNHPLMPTLYDDAVINLGNNNWDKLHIWVHKPPLFLWQIMLSFKIFGISEFSLRLPSAILGIVLVIIGYRSGKLLVNKRVGYITSLLIISSSYVMELISGRQELDSNDFTFLVYISLSIWAFIEYYYSGKKIWLVFIGLFSGLAILCKWVVGLLVYFGWFIYKVQEKKFKISQYKDFLIALLITLIIVLPWQILIFSWYPAEAKQSYSFFLRHASEPLDGHVGSFWYHFDKFNIIYGNLASFLIIPSLIVLYNKIRDRKLFIALIAMIIVVYLFFSFVTTRMPSFTTVVSMLIFIAFAALTDYVFEKIGTLRIHPFLIKLMFFIIIVVWVITRIDIESVQEKHTGWKADNYLFKMQTHNKQIFKSLQLPSYAVIFNLKKHNFEAMFYTGLTAYYFIPDESQCKELKEKGKMIAVFEPANGVLPDYLVKDTSVIVIRERVEDNE